MQTKVALNVQIRTTPALILAGKLLRLPGDSVEELIVHELAANPALEAHERRAALYSRGFEAPVAHQAWDAQTPRSAVWGGIDADMEMADRIPACETAIDQLIAQARLAANESDLDAVIYLLHSLDEHGFLNVEINVLARELHTSRVQIERALQILHSLHPPGIGARDVRECLLIQCASLQENLATENRICDNACRILDRAWDDFIHQRNERVARALGIAVSDVENAKRFMQNHLHPYPIQLVQDTTDEAAAPTYVDLIVHRVVDAQGATFTIEVPAAERYELRLCHEFERVLHKTNDEGQIEPSQREWLNQTVGRARIFIDALDHRWATMRRIGEYLIKYQADFFEHGPRHLKPLTRAALATALGVHESTISRAVSDKTVQLPNGRLIPLGYLFDASLAPKEAIRQVLARANHALSDREIVMQLHEQGMCLTRRTVAKYRGQLGLSKRYRSQHLTASTVRRR